MKKKVKKNRHDDVVLQVGNVLKALGTVCADLNSAYDSEHTFDPKFVLPEVPPELLSAFVPTQMLFTCRPNMAVLSKSRVSWKEPDLAIKSENDYVYVAEIYDFNDPNAEISRKIETVILNSTKCKIVGLAMVAKGNWRYEEAEDELKRLRQTFHSLFGAKEENESEDDLCVYLRLLFTMHPSYRKYGMMWERILWLNSHKDSDWESQLCTHARAALASKEVMVSQSGITT